MVADWWNFADYLITRYNDGFLNTPDKIAQRIGYPEEWRKAVGYADGPTTYEKK